MKTVYDKNYKGYRVEVFAEFKEGTKVERPLGKSVPSIIYDSVRFEAKYHTEYGYSRPVYRTIEGKRENRKEIYERFAEELNEVVNILEKKIDQLVREREITEGLPESLLTVDESSDEKEEGGLYDAVYEVAIQAIEDTDAKKVVEVVDKFMKALEKLNKEFH